MKSTSQSWAIVLAAGEGSRLRDLTADRRGGYTPKQFCSLAGGESLLESALKRARRHVPRDRILVVVAAEHERWWRGELARLPRENVIVQPRNRGTAAGILLPLLELARRDPEARLIVLPSDHFVFREQVLETSLRQALAEARGLALGAILLGITPDAPEPDYGWIVPAAARSSGTQPVATFVEKPNADHAEALLARGGVWNSFLLATNVRALLSLYRQRLPSMLEAFEAALDAGAPRETSIAALYAALEPADFSRQILQGSEEELRMLSVPACGWTDLGTPERVAECLACIESARPVRSSPREIQPARLDLSWALGSMGTRLPARPSVAGV